MNAATKQKRRPGRVISKTDALRACIKELKSKITKQTVAPPANIPLGAEFFDRLPDSAQVDVRTVAAHYDVSVGTVWRWARIGLLPKPHKAGPNTTRWVVGDIRSATSRMNEFGSSIYLGMSKPPFNLNIEIDVPELATEP